MQLIHVIIIPICTITQVTLEPLDAWDRVVKELISLVSRFLSEISLLKYRSGPKFFTLRIQQGRIFFSEKRIRRFERGISKNII